MVVKNPMHKIPKTQYPVFLLIPEVTSFGGIQSYMKRLLEALSADENNMPMAISVNDTESSIKKSGLTSQVIGCAKSKLHFVWAVFRLCPMNAVVISGHIGQSPVGWLLKKIGRAKKHVIILHGIEAWQRSSWLERIALQNADIIVATTNYTARLCAKKNDLDENKFRIIPLCCEDRSVVTDHIQSSDNKFKILSVGRMAKSERHKGFDTLIHAFSDLIQHGEKASLFFIGNGDDCFRLEQLADEMGLIEQVNFFNNFNDDELHRAYESCDVFVLPSKKEGFGIVFLEAMQHGRPCIGGNHGGTPEVIKHGVTGYLVDWNDSEMLANYLSELMGSKILRESMGNAARRRYEEHYTALTFYCHYQDLLEQISEHR